MDIHFRSKNENASPLIILVFLSFSYIQSASQPYNAPPIPRPVSRFFAGGPCCQLSILCIPFLVLRSMIFFIQDLLCVPAPLASRYVRVRAFCQVMFVMARFFFIFSTYLFSSFTVITLYCVNLNK